MFFAVVAVLCVSVCQAGDGPLPEAAGTSMVTSSIYLWKGDQYLRQGEVDLATECYLKASRYMRTSPSPHFALARVYLQRSPMDAFLEFARGLQLLISDFFYQSIVVSNLMVILLVAAGAAIYVAVIVIVVRHSRTVWLAIILNLPPHWIGRYPSMVIMACVFAFFLILSGRSLLGILTWTIVMGCGLLWRFASASERRTVISFAIFLVLFGLILDSTTLIISTQHPDSPLRLAALGDRVGREKLERTLVEQRTPSRRDPVNDFMQGLQLVRTGKYVRAIERLELASKSDKDNAAILNNLGVAFHGLGQFAQAKAKFEEALRSSPREAVIHYNYSQTLNALLQYDLAQEELAKASTLDFDLTRALITEETGSSLVPMNLQTRVLWQLAMATERRVISMEYHPVESGSAGTGVLILLAGLAIAAMRKTKCPARCEICGCTVQTRVTKRRRKDILCPGCRLIKTNNANDHDRLEHQIRDRIGRLQLRRTVLRVVIGLLIPGSTYHLSGKRFKGFMVSVSVFSLLILAVSGGALIKPVPQLKLDSLTGWTLPAFILAYAIYAWRSTVAAVKNAKET
jgi:Tfp pilus assembly protein PilF